jgi:predicted enzyme related to lactoylglutathione lyase
VGKKVVHVEFPSQDADRAQRFWEGVGGWSFQDSGMPGIDYRMFQDGESGGAVFPKEGSMADVEGPVLYFGSDDIDADLAKVRELGGEAEDKQPIPTVGWFARCKDTEGNPFSLFQGDDSVPMPGA